MAQQTIAIGQPADTYINFTVKPAPRPPWWRRLFARRKVVYLHRIQLRGN